MDIQACGMPAIFSGDPGAALPLLAQRLTGEGMQQRARTSPSPASVDPVSHADFRSFISSSKIVVLRVGWGALSPFSPSVASYFRAEYAGRVRLGHFDRAQVPTPQWLLRHVGAVFKKAAPSLTEVPDGYYLFLNGHVVAFHPHTVGDPDSDLKVLGAGLLAGLVFPRLGEMVAGTVDQRDGRAVIEHFDAVLAQAARLATTGKRKEAEVEAPPDPYAILGVAPDASFEDITAAKKRQLQENHPDLVARMSKPIRELAESRSRAINEAFEQIKKLRGAK